MIVGPFKESFIKAAVDSCLELVDELVFVDTAPGDNPSRPYLNFLKESCIMPVKIVEMERGEDKDFSFAEARDLARQNSSNKWCLRLDADEVLHEKDISCLRQYVAMSDASAIEVAFYHHMVYPCLYQYIEPKIILFRRDLSSWTKGVHELVQFKGTLSKLHEVKFNHYGYCRGQAEVFKRWKLYTDIDNKPTWYDGYDPNNILTDRISVCKKYDTSHPKYVINILAEIFGDGYDVCPFDEIQTRAGFSIEAHMIGLLYICKDDNNTAALSSLLETINVPTIIYIADMKSSKECVDQINTFRLEAKNNEYIKEVIYDRFTKIESLSVTMNKAFKYFIGRTDVRFVGWFHPDMVAEKGWLVKLVTALHNNSTFGKVSAYNPRDRTVPEQSTYYEGHEQAYLIPKSVLQEVGLFDEGYLGIGGYEDWDLNRRIRLAGYQIVIDPYSRVYHIGMVTRQRKDQSFFEQMNKNRYMQKWGTDKEVE